MTTKESDSTLSINLKTTGELTRLLDNFDESIRALSTLERSVSHWDDWFVHLLVSKLDSETRQDWEKSLESHNRYAEYKELTTFLENRARTLQNTQTHSKTHENPSPRKESLTFALSAVGAKVSERSRSFPSLF